MFTVEVKVAWDIIKGHQLTQDINLNVHHDYFSLLQYL